MTHSTHQALRILFLPLAMALWWPALSAGQDPVQAVTTDFWDINAGATGHASPSDRGGALAISNAFGGAVGATTQAIFADDANQPLSIEWQSAQPIKLDQVGLFLGHDLSNPNNRRALDVVVKAKLNPADPYVTVFERGLPSPYGGGQFGASTTEFFSILDATLPLPAAQYFRVEFVKNTAGVTGGVPNTGVRVFELDGLGSVASGQVSAVFVDDFQNEAVGTGNPGGPIFGGSWTFSEVAAADIQVNGKILANVDAENSRFLRFDNANVATATATLDAAAITNIGDNANATLSFDLRRFTDGGNAHGFEVEGKSGATDAFRLQFASGMGTPLTTSSLHDVSYFDPDANAFLSTGLTVETQRFNDIAVFADLLNETFSLTIDGNVVSDLPLLGNFSTLTGFEFTHLGGPGAFNQLDNVLVTTSTPSTAVPEPVGLLTWLMLSGVLGVCAWRRRWCVRRTP